MENSKTKKTIKMSDSFRMIVEKIKKEKGLDGISESYLFRRKEMDFYFPVLWSYPADMGYIKNILENEEFNTFFDHAKYSVEDKDKLARIVYQSDEVVALQLVFK